MFRKLCRYLRREALPRPCPTAVRQWGKYYMRQWSATAAREYRLGVVSQSDSEWRVRVNEKVRKRNGLTAP